MQAFRATYKPRKYDNAGNRMGYNDERAETVLVLEVFPSRTNAVGGEQMEEAVIIRGDGSLDVVPIDCLAECFWVSSGKGGD